MFVVVANVGEDGDEEGRVSWSVGDCFRTNSTRYGTATRIVELKQGRIWTPILTKVFSVHVQPRRLHRRTHLVVVVNVNKGCAPNSVASGTCNRFPSGTSPCFWEKSVCSFTRCSAQSRLRCRKGKGRAHRAFNKRGQR